jgi:hypothetical protein
MQILQFYQRFNRTCDRLEIVQTRAHPVRGEWIMRRVALAAGVIAALLVGAGPALAFQETPEAPPEALSVAPDASKDPAVQMQTPATGSASQPAEKSGAKVLGFNILPKMDFGLELLYSQQPMELQQATPLAEDNEDLTVLGKVKRHF